MKKRVEMAVSVAKILRISNYALEYLIHEGE